MREPRVVEQSEKMSLGIGRRPYSNGSLRVRSRVESFCGGVSGGAIVSSAMDVEDKGGETDGGRRENVTTEFRSLVVRFLRRESGVEIGRAHV